MHVQNVVKVTRRGQTTIPAALRKKFGIKEGDNLVVEATEKGVLFKIVPKLEDMAGIDAQYGNPEEIKKEIEKLREEY
jgi:AbrB family looped-hinge helix DNA binding protein